MRIAIFGVGGIGAVLGARLVRAEHDVVFIARGRQLEAIATGGLSIEHPSDPFRVGPVRASDDPAEFGSVDLVVLCVKAWQVEAAAGSIGPLLADHTGVLTLQNGVDAPELVAKRIGAGHVLPGLIRIISYVIEPGRARDDGYPAQIMFAEQDGTDSPRTTAVIEAMARAGIDALVPEDIQVELWRKLLFIASTSGVGAATRANFGEFLAVDPSRDLLRTCQEEIGAVARAAGVDLADSVVDDTMAFTDTLPPETTASMQRDIMEGRPSELFDQTGAVVRIGESLGVDVPVNRALLGALLPQERRARASSQIR